MIPSTPRSVDEAIARFDEVIARYDGGTAEAAGARRRYYGRMAKSVGRRIGNMGLAIAGLIAATIAFSQIVGPIGWTGLFIVSLLTLATLALFSVWPGEPKRIAYNEQLPTRTVIQQLESLLVRERPALPGPATRRVDAISAQLPLLEAKLEQIPALDPLAQDARRLMGKHLPELIERYERVPAEYRRVRDGEGMTVDERLTAGLDTASQALEDLARKLAREDLDAFETQGRFIESRYKDPDAGLTG
jgi:hypothetical protein